MVQDLRRDVPSVRMSTSSQKARHFCVDTKVDTSVTLSVTVTSA